MIKIATNDDYYTDIIVPRTHARESISFILGRKELKSSEEVKKLAQEWLNYALDLTIGDMEIWINSKVAKLTGAMRASLVKFLKRSKPPPIAENEIRDIRLVLGVGSDIFYAKYVNKMTKSNVRHEIDPRAVGFYHKKMVAFGQERFQINLRKAKNEYLEV